MASFCRKVECVPFPWEPMLDENLEGRKVASLKCLERDMLVNRASVCQSPLQHVSVTPCGSCASRLFIPRAAVLSCPLQDIEVPPLGRLSACAFIPWAAVLYRPLQDGEMSLLRGTSARVGTPWTAVCSQPLQNRELTCFCRNSKSRILRELHSHPFSLVHCSTGRWEFKAAQLQVDSSNGQLFSLSH